MLQFTYKDLKMVIRCVKDLCFWQWVKVLSGNFYEIKNLVLDFDICTMTSIEHLPSKYSIFHQSSRLYYWQNIQLLQQWKNVFMTITYPLGFQNNWHYVNWNFNILILNLILKKEVGPLVRIPNFSQHYMAIVLGGL